MKFPKNFNLPSKEQLIKKVSVFGAVDSSNTRVSWYCGSAQVAFFEESDAVAAYQYAKCWRSRSTESHTKVMEQTCTSTRSYTHTHLIFYETR
jgi:hypothetical protein